MCNMDRRLNFTLRPNHQLTRLANAKENFIKWLKQFTKGLSFITTIKSVVVEHIRVNKEFKLGGTVGDGKNCLGYGTIYFRMLEDLNNVFKQKEVISGVVRAMQGGSELSQWFERHPGLEWDEFLGILRNHYQLENYGQMLMNYGKEF